MKQYSLQRSIVVGLISLVSVLAPWSAFADEVWQSNFGKVVYQEDFGTTAKWTYDSFPDGAIFLEGLAGVYTNRGSYGGYWVQSLSEVRCDTFRQDRYGQPSYYWGQLSLTFIDADFPSRWQALWGYCGQEPSRKWSAKPLTN